MINFHLGDCVQWAREYDGPLFHAMLTDPPYHLTSIVKRFGSKKAAAAKPGRDGAFGRVSRGFMGQSWDGGDLAFDPETWAAFLRVLYPGAFCVAFAGSRGFHRMMVAIEDAGFIIHPALFGWAYGSGLPKATKVKGDDRFTGHRYGLQALKPALEPIVIFQKPYEGRALTNIQETGAGTLNIDGTRISGESYVINRYNGLRPFGGGDGPYETVTISGRWASNFLLLDPGAAQALGDPSRFFFQVAEQIDSADPVVYCKKAGRTEKEAGLDGMPERELGHNRFDKCANCGGYMFQNQDRPSACKCENPQRENNKMINPHPTVKPLVLTKYLATLLLPPSQFLPRRLFVPFSGVGSECIGAMQAGWNEIEGVEKTPEYIPIADARAEYWQKKTEKEAARQLSIL